MDGVEADHRYPTACVQCENKRVGGRVYFFEVVDFSRDGSLPSADLGGSSKYSTANIED